VGDSRVDEMMEFAHLDFLGQCLLSMGDGRTVNEVCTLDYSMTLELLRLPIGPQP